jgi:hypothetical protein
VGDGEALPVREGRGDRVEVTLPLYEAVPLADWDTEGEGEGDAEAVARAADGERELVADSVREPHGVSLLEAVEELEGDTLGVYDAVALALALRETLAEPLLEAVRLAAPTLAEPQRVAERERAPDREAEGEPEGEAVALGLRDGAGELERLPLALL